MPSPGRNAHTLLQEWSTSAYAYFFHRTRSVESATKLWQLPDQLHQQPVVPEPCHAHLCPIVVRRRADRASQPVLDPRPRRAQMGLGLLEPRLPGRSVSRTTPRRRACVGPEARVDLALLATLVAKDLDATGQKRAPIMSFLHRTRNPHTRLRIPSLSRGQNPRVPGQTSSSHARAFLLFPLHNSTPKDSTQ